MRNGSGYQGIATDKKCSQYSQLYVHTQNRFVFLSNNLTKFPMLYTGVPGPLGRVCIVNGSAMRLCSSKSVVSPFGQSGRATTATCFSSLKLALWQQVTFLWSPLLLQVALNSAQTAGTHHPTIRGGGTCRTECTSTQAKRMECKKFTQNKR